MDHGQLSQALAEKIRYLRTHIEAASIPTTRVDESLIVGTWNIREFGKKPRSRDAIHLIAEVIFNYDLLVLVELRDNLRDLRRALDILGPSWKVVFSDYRQDQAGNRERIAFVYDARMVEFTGLAAEANPPRKKVNGLYQPIHEDWWRSPYMASFIAGNFDFIIVAAHMRWGDSVADREAAIGYLADWIEDRRNDKGVADRDILVMGDFNIPNRNHATFRALTKHGLRVPRSLLGVQGTNLSEANTYDQIAHYPTNSNRFTDHGGVIQFFDAQARNGHSKLFPGLSKAEFTYQLSDHLPLWVEVDTWVEDEELDAVLARYGTG